LPRVRLKAGIFPVEDQGLDLDPDLNLEIEEVSADRGSVREVPGGEMEGEVYAIGRLIVVP
jgi:hypothetical protein